MNAAATPLLDQLLNHAAAADAFRRGRDLAAGLHELCRRAGDADFSTEREEAARRIAALSPAEIGEVMRFVAARFHLHNQAEQVNIIRVNRERAAHASPERPRPESLPEALLRLKAAGMNAAAVRTLVERLDVQPTLTAHPTEAKRRSVLDNLVRIASAFDTALEENCPQHERRALHRRLDQLMQILLATDDVRPKRLEVIDEVRNGLFFLKSSIWSAAPHLMRDLAEASEDVFEPGALTLTDLPALLRYRSWIGGDRDGNPRVTHAVTSATLQMLRSAAIELWDRELLELQQELTLSRRRVSIPSWFVEIVDRDGERFVDDVSSLEQRQYEPIRIRLMQLRGRIKHDDTYNGATLVSDLLAIRDALGEAGLRDVAYTGRLADAIVRARVFGLHLATLDIRQHSRVHEAAVTELLALAGVHDDYAALPEPERVQILRAELANPRPLRPIDAPLSPETAELMHTLHAVRQAVAIDRRAVRSYVVSMTHGLSDILEVLLLTKEAGLTHAADGPDGAPRLLGMLHVVPLLETIDDLERGESLVAAMLDEPLYRSYIDALAAGVTTRADTDMPLQEIMLGYSDSNKDGGFLMANLALDRAQRRIADAVHSRGALLRFFHGRGGTIGRGGGRAGRAILATPPAARTGRLRFTEQGEVISFRYAMPAIAERHLEQILNAALLASADIREPEHDPRLPELLTRMAQISMDRYRALIDDPEFWPWFTSTGPIAPIAGLPIASRPVMRAAGSGLGEQQSAFDQLRAIPWVFSWVQMRCLAPGWFGLGAALNSATPEEFDLLAREYRRSSWLATVIDNAASELLRARMPIVRRYALAEPTGAAGAGARIFETLRSEFDAAVRGVLRVSGRAALGDETPIIAGSIHERNPWTDVLNLIQIDLLARSRAAPDHDRQALEGLLQQSVSAIAAAMQSTG